MNGFLPAPELVLKPQRSVWTSVDEFDPNIEVKSRLKHLHQFEFEHYMFLVKIVEISWDKKNANRVSTPSGKWIIYNHLFAVHSFFIANIVNIETAWVIFHRFTCCACSRWHIILLPPIYNHVQNVTWSTSTWRLINKLSCFGFWMAVAKMWSGRKLQWKSKAWSLSFPRCNENVRT